ncbi:reticulon-1-A-like isoform X2 [Convolutriloba macropyga]|uniref:reticulon-1-A-like isoform X2 n=1 Tax=Convolutriloba macropyga TaxID=536237 RepID=UPI003F51F640
MESQIGLPPVNNLETPQQNSNPVQPKRPRDWFSGCSPEFVQLIFWESPKRTGSVFGTVLSLLLCFASFSLISIVAYSTLLLLALSTAFTVYRRIHGSISKSAAASSASTKDSHPLRALLELDLTVKPSRLASVLEPLCDPFNRFVIRARAIILIENVLDSAKFGVMMWLLTYIGACFNALSLVMLTWVGFFTVPVLYEKNQHFVDSMVGQIAKKTKQTMSDAYANVEPKLQAALDKMPPAVRNAFSQIISSKPTEKIQ